MGGGGLSLVSFFFFFHAHTQTKLTIGNCGIPGATVARGTIIAAVGVPANLTTGLQVTRETMRPRTIANAEVAGLLENFILGE